MAAPYNETAVIELIDNQAFYNANLGPFLAGLAVQMFMMGVLCTYPTTFLSWAAQLTDYDTQLCNVGLTSR